MTVYAYYHCRSHKTYYFIISCVFVYTNCVINDILVFVICVEMCFVQLVYSHPICIVGTSILELCEGPPDQLCGRVSGVL